MRISGMITCLLALNSVFADEIVQDFFPVSKGNYWNYDSKRRWEIVSSSDGTGLDLMDDNKRISLNLKDDLGRINNPQFAMIGGGSLPIESFKWAPNAVLPRIKTINGSWGSSNLSYDFIQNAGHMDQRFGINVPGIGPVQLHYKGQIANGLVENVKDYFVKKVPAAIIDNYKSVQSESPGFSSIALKGDTCVVTFRAITSRIGKFYTVSSFNPLTQCLRLYVTDTSSAIAIKATWFEHTIKIVNCEINKKYLIKIFETEYGSPMDYAADSIVTTTKLLFNEQFPPTTSIVNGAKRNMISDEMVATYNHLDGSIVIGLPKSMLVSYGKISIINTQGKVILQQKRLFDQHMQICLKNGSDMLPAKGIYVLKIEAGEKEFSKSLYIGK
jgi:hypothetical protein